MKNIQIVDGAANATFSIFQATEEEFALISPDGSDLEVMGELIERVGVDEAGRVLTLLWQRPVLKSQAMGIQGTRFYDAEFRRELLPISRREVDWNESSINEAQRDLHRRHR